MALINWTLSEVMKKGFTPLTTPEIVRSSVVEKCGFQPRGANTQVCMLFIPLSRNENAALVCCLQSWASCGRPSDIKLMTNFIF